MKDDIRLFLSQHLQGNLVTEKIEISYQDSPAYNICMKQGSKAIFYNKGLVHFFYFNLACIYVHLYKSM